MAVWISLSAVFICLFGVLAATRSAASKRLAQKQDATNRGSDASSSTYGGNDCNDGGNAGSCDAGGGGDGGGGD